MPTTDTPIPYITLEGPKDAQKFVVHEDAAKIIREADGEVAVVSVAGLYRTGKSYVLNRLAGSNHGFKIGSSVEPCTQGIWMWVVPPADLATLAKDGLAGKEPGKVKNLTLVLLDTEGIGSYKKSKTYDVQIFALAVLLSSFFIYNSMGSIDESALDRLSLVVELTKHIKSQADTENEDPYLLSRFFPKFLWLVRDFSLKLVVEGNEVSSNEYLENALRPLQGDPNRVKAKNLIRSSITQFFTDRSCFTLKRPVTDEAQLQHLEKLTEEELRPQFLAEMQQLCNYVYKTLRPKQLYGEHLNGRMFVELTKNYVEAINSGSVPTIRSAWDGVVEVECARAAQAALELYEKRFEKLASEGKILESNDMEKEHVDTRDEALRSFRAQARGGDIAVKHETKLLEEIQLAREHHGSLNDERSSLQCRELLDKIVVQIEDQIQHDSGKGEENRISTLEVLQTTWETVIDETYKPLAKGPKKFDVLSEIQQRKLTEHAHRVSRRMIRKAEEQFDDRLAKAKQQSEEEKRRIEALYEDVKASWTRTREQLQEVDRENKQLIGVIANLAKATD